MHPAAPTQSQWIAHLRSLSDPILAPLPLQASDDERQSFADTFRDEFGARTPSAAALIARILQVRPTSLPEHPDLDAQLWHALAADQPTPTARIPKDPTHGLADPNTYAIEHRTHIELCALHALTHVVPTDQLTALIDWNIAELQPDNGINRPWAIHAFIFRALTTDDQPTQAAAALHAQTLAHNCCVTMGQPDIVSAFILRDSADWLDKHTT